MFGATDRPGGLLLRLGGPSFLWPMIRWAVFGAAGGLYYQELVM